MNRSANKIPILLFIGVALVLGGFFLKIKKNQADANAKAINEIREDLAKAQTELGLLRTEANQRLDILADMVKMKAFAQKVSEDVERKSTFLKTAELKNQIEFDQFDQLQNDLSNRIAEYFVYVQKNPALSASATFKNMYKRVEVVERGIEARRGSYTVLAQKVNAGLTTHPEFKKDFQPLPTFRAAAQALEAAPKNDK